MGDPPYHEIRSLMYDPPYLSPGWAEIIKPASPAAGQPFTRAVPSQWWEVYRAITFTLTTAAVAGQRQPVINYADADGFIFDQVIAGTSPGLSTVMTAFMNDHTPTPATFSPALDTTASVTGPGAGAVIASLVLPAGTYTVSWTVALFGTTAAADANNFQLVSGAAVLMQAIIGSASGTVQPQLPTVIDVPTGGITLSVQAVAAGTGTAVYRAELVASPTSGLTYYGQLPVLAMRPGWSVQIAVTGMNAGDVLSAIGLHTQRFPSDFAGGTVWRDREAAERAVIAEILHGG